MNRTQARRFGRVETSGWATRVDHPPATQADRPAAARADHPSDRPAATRADRPGDRLAAIRPVCPADLPALDDFFAGLSAQTRYLRFFGPVTPGPAMLRQLSGAEGNADAVVAVHGAAIVGHAMAVDRPGAEGRNGPEGRTELDETRARTTDVGVVVADAWQGRGAGSALMRTLIARAWARGVSSVAMDVLRDNRRVLAMIAGHWPSARVEHTPDCTTIWFSRFGVDPGPWTDRGADGAPDRPGSPDQPQMRPIGLFRGGSGLRG